jgi:FtsP/CotA-like multicopper oxidase with cupredoxin domain
MGLLINGQMPGPLIEANWGDTVIIHLENKLQDNGTSLHFHGMRQLNTNEMDGVPSITQCALAPGEKMTYTFVASNYGSTWYHSHFALQTYDGVFGPMTIHGPSSAEYDIDAGFAVLQDWSHQTVEAQYHNAETVGAAPEFGPRTLDTGLINGKNLWSPDNGTTVTGSRFEMTFQPGKTHLIRVVNTAIQSTFKFHIDGHKFTVISADFVPIVPYETDILNINIGQRYNILVKADQEPGDYWMRSDNQQACAQLHNSRDIKGIVHYAGCNGTPNTVSREYVDECIDEPYEKLVPVAPLFAGPQTSQIHKNILVGEGPNTPNLFKWTLDGNTFQSQWGDPTLGGIYWNDTIPSYSGNLAIEVPKLKEWVYIIVESPVALPHPIHLHGHDSLVLAQGTGPYSDDVALKLDNPPRRDTALMPFNPQTKEGGYLVIAFETDNPGAWL